MAGLHVPRVSAPRSIQIERLLTLAAITRYGAQGVLWFCYWTPRGFPTDGAIITPKRGPDGTVVYRQGVHYAHAQRINSVLKVYGNYLLGAQSTSVFRGNGSSTTNVTLRKTRPPAPSALKGGCLKAVVGHAQLRAARW